jgi:hypothetical protein
MLWLVADPALSLIGWADPPLAECLAFEVAKIVTGRANVQARAGLARIAAVAAILSAM